MTMDCQVFDVGNEAEPPYHQLLEVVQDRLVHIDYSAASLADEVVMVAHFDVVVAESTPSQVGLCDQSELLEELERSVDSGAIDVRMCGADLIINILCGDMSIGTVKHFQHC